MIAVPPRKVYDQEPENIVTNVAKDVMKVVTKKTLAVKMRKVGQSGNTSTEICRSSSSIDSRVEKRPRKYLSEKEE